MSAPQSYYVPVDAGEAEFTEKRSRFLGHVRRVETEAEARAFLDEMRKKYYDARHNCWCFDLHDGTVRYGDDGEPQGTAGQPMLNVFQREGVENVVCIVTRYFGGILLGAGGLTRAYAKAAKDALDKAGKARISGGAVILQHDGQKHGIGKAVSRAVQPAERVRDGVHIADACARERRACVERGLKHRRAVGERRAVAVRALQMREDGHDGMFREQARLLRVVKAAQVRFDRVRQRVHAGFRRDVWRQADGQRGV